MRNTTEKAEGKTQEENIVFEKEQPMDSAPGHRIVDPAASVK